MEYDIIIIGAGPGGYVAAIRAAQLRKKVCLIEKGSLGGTCLNAGCIPTKSLLKSIDMMEEIKKNHMFGIEGIEVDKIHLNIDKLREKKNDIVRTLVSGIEMLLKKNKVTVINGTATILDKNTVMVGDEKMYAESIIIATGSKPKKLLVPISEKMPVLTSSEVLDLNKIYDSMVVIGGGVVGIELAYFLSSIGVKITIIEFLDRILPMVDKEITVLVEKQLSSMGITVITGANVKEICNEKVIFSVNNKIDEVMCDAIMVSVGREPNTESLELENAGIKTSGSDIATNSKMQTNIKNIYAIGDVNGKSMLAHTASMEGIIAIDNICDGNNEIDYSIIPNAIYLNPEIASVGLTEDEAKEKYKKIKIGKFPMIGNGKSLIEGNQNGFIKIICNDHNLEILGAHLYCARATDMISELSLAMNLECTADDMSKVIHPHPTISEGIAEAMYAVNGNSIHY